jgi:hypothetical protein
MSVPIVGGVIHNGGPSPAVLGVKCSECHSPATQIAQGELRCEAHRIPEPPSRASGKGSHRGRLRRQRTVTNRNSTPPMERGPDPKAEFTTSPFRDPENTVGVPQAIHLR